MRRMMFFAAAFVVAGGCGIFKSSGPMLVFSCSFDSKHAIDEFRIWDTDMTTFSGI